MDKLIRSIIVRLVHLFYPRIEVHGRERLPTQGPAIFVLNHPNALLDPLLLMAVLDREVAFLAKSTLFKNPLMRRLLEAFGVLPVYRQQDSGRFHGATNTSPTRNEETFERCRELLRRGGWLALFPEGETHSNPALMPIKTGAARIALSAEAAANWQLGLKVVPVGLWYEIKTRFRSAALVVIGEPFTIDSYAADYAADSQRVVRALTNRIIEGLSQVVLQADDAELLDGTTTLATWLAMEEQPPTLAQRYQRAAALLAAYRRQAQGDSGRLRKLAQQARRTSHRLRQSRIQQPWMLDLSAARRRRLIFLILVLLPSLPLVVAGFVLSYLPYRLTQLIAPRLIQHPAQLGTSKLALGAVLMLTNWLAMAALAARRAGRWRGLQLLLAAPLLSYIALLWTEGWRELRELLHLSWLHSFRVQLTRQLIEQRRRIRAQIGALLHE